MLGEKPEELEEAVKDITVYQKERFELVLRKFQPYVGKTTEEIEKTFGVALSRQPKNYIANFARAVFGEGKKLRNRESWHRHEDNWLERTACRRKYVVPSVRYMEIVKED